MLKRIRFILSKNYGERIKETGELCAFTNEMKRHGTEVVLCEKADRADAIENMVRNENSETTLYLSDDSGILSFLQKQGCYTIAVYHEGVSNILSGTQFAIEGIEGVEWEYLYKVYQRFLGQPWHITETKRCTIREMGVEDVDDLYEIYKSPSVVRYTEPLFEDRQREIQYTENYIENVYKYYGFGVWLIHRREDGQLLGRAGFSYRPGYEDVELGFVIGEAFWRKGYAYEVCSHLMELGKTVYEFERVQAFVKRENVASVGLLKKLGFSYVEDVTMDGQEYERFVSELAI